MKQVVRRGFKDIVVEEVPEPGLLPRHVLIRPVYSLISSGTEAASIHSELLKEVAGNPSHLRKIWDAMKVAGPLRTLAEVRAKFSEYASIGYSGAGLVIDKDPALARPEIGEPVVYGGEWTGHAEVVRTGVNLVARVPEGVPFEQACFTTLGSIAMHAVRTAEIGMGDVVAVVGLGLVGQLVAQLVRAQGGVAIGIDLREDRTDLARRLGAEHAFAGTGAEAVKSVTNGRGADCVIIAAASKSSAPAQLALEACRERGRIVVVGAVELTFPWEKMYLKEIRLLMSRAYGAGSYDPAYEVGGQDYPASYVRWTEQRNMEEFLRLLEARRIDVAALITHRFPLEQAAEAYRTILDPSAGSLAVLLRFPAAEAPAAPRAVRIIEVSRAAPGPHELGVAVAGAGNLARWAHLPNLKKTPGVTVRAIYSDSGVRGKSYARRFGAAYCSTDYDAILADPSVHMVMVLSRNQHHAGQALAALAAGKHVFVEKPLALTVEECGALCRAVRDSGKQLTVGFNRRFAPFYLEQKRRLAQRPGPAVINCRVNSPGISGSYWMADPAAGGAILGEACHFVDLMYWLLESEPVEVAAFSLPRGEREPIGENNLAATFRFEDGSIGTLTYATVGSKTSGGERVEVFAQGLGAVCQDFKRLEIHTGMRRTYSKWWGEKGYAAQLESFIEGIRDGKPAAVSVRDGARATIGCLRMLEAARTGSVLPIDLDAVLEPASRS